MPVQITNSTYFDSKNVVNSASIINDGLAMNSNFRDYSWNE